MAISMERPYYPLEPDKDGFEFCYHFVPYCILLNLIIFASIILFIYLFFLKETLFF